MPYSEAVIMEVMRNASVLPLLPRTSMADTQLVGCHVPKVRILIGHSYISYLLYFVKRIAVRRTDILFISECICGNQFLKNP